MTALWQRLRGKCSALAPALVLFAIMLAHALLETARDALFLTRLGPERLASAYVAIAITALAVVWVLRKRLGHTDPRRTLTVLLVASSAGTALLGATLGIQTIVFALYVWTGLVATLVVPTFWVMVDRGIFVGDAKRTFAVVAAGGSVGALVGSGLAAGLGRIVQPEVLVFLSAIALAIAGFAAWKVNPNAAERHRTQVVRQARRAKKYAARSTRYVYLLLALGLISTIAVTLGDLMFKRTLAERLPSEDLATWFGAIYTGLNIIGLLVQLVVTPRLLDRLGVGGALTVLPIVVLATTLGFLLTGAAIALVALRLGDGGLRHSVHRVASEILFLPIAHEHREAAKPIVDVVGQRGGQLIAALLAFAVATDGAGTWQLGVMTAIAVAAWFVAIVLTRSSYVHLFRDTLAAGEIARESHMPTLDGSAVAMLSSALSSPDETEALAALDLLVLRGGAIPTLVLYHPSTTVVRRALSAIRDHVRPDVARVLGHLATHKDPQIRAAALAASARAGCTACLSSALHDAAPDVRAAAAIGLVFEAKHDVDLGQAAIEKLVAGSSEERSALVRAIGRVPGTSFKPVLDYLARQRDLVVIGEILLVWESSPALADVDRLIQLLDEPLCRSSARRVFAAAGASTMLPRLIAALDDPRTPIGVRRHLPRTISRYRTQGAVAALVERLGREPDGTTEFKILRALGRMRQDQPKLAIDPAPVEKYALRAIDDAQRYTTLGDRLRAERGIESATKDLLGELMSEKRRHAIERAFRALGILHPRADMHSVHDAITSIDEERIGAAREVLDGLVDADLRLPLIAVLDARDTPHQLAMTYEELLTALLVDPSDTLRCVAAHHVAERHLVALRGELMRLKPDAQSSLVMSAFDQALEVLDA